MTTQRQVVAATRLGLRPSWDEYGLTLAFAAATRADCIRRQIGAVVMGPDHRLISCGYNGSPAGQPGCLSDNACPRAMTKVLPGSPYDDCIAVHAEANALLYAERSRVLGATIYITQPPCTWCRLLIRGAGISRIVYEAADGTVIKEDDLTG